MCRTTMTTTGSGLPWQGLLWQASAAILGSLAYHGSNAAEIGPSRMDSGTGEHVDRDIRRSATRDAAS
jgi:hypothetical protein